MKTELDAITILQADGDRIFICFFRKNRRKRTSCFPTKSSWNRLHKFIDDVIPASISWYANYPSSIVQYDKYQLVKRRN